MRLPALDGPLTLRLRIGGIVFGLKFIAKRRRLPASWQPPDIFKAAAYRHAYFGRPFLRAAHDVLRGESDWTVGERELFAAFVSALNQCPF